MDYKEAYKDAVEFFNNVKKLNEKYEGHLVDLYTVKYIESDILSGLEDSVISTVIALAYDVNIHGPYDDIELKKLRFAAKSILERYYVDEDYLNLASEQILKGRFSKATFARLNDVSLEVLLEMMATNLLLLVKGDPKVEIIHQNGVRAIEMIQKEWSSRHPSKRNK